ncbi:geminin-like [Melanaphis sacchari]|uniref:Geminin n=1 Tax=Melanaphis sacchari TaxID=742174 RepID=A0A2H8TUH8_9HEMI|nr:geminin-like [Melanaphis sacchari]
MKTVTENNRNISDKMSIKKGTRKFLQTLQPSGGDKENLVGTGRFHENNPDPKILKPQLKTEVEVKSKEKQSIIEKINPSLYKKLIIEDLTSTAGPSEKYWEVIAERRRKALEEVLDQNRKLHSVIMALEEENASCKKLLEQTTDLVNTLKEVLNEDDKQAEDDDDVNLLVDSKQSNSNNDFSCSESD